MVVVVWWWCSGVVVVVWWWWCGGAGVVVLCFDGCNDKNLWHELEEGGVGGGRELSIKIDLIVDLPLINQSESG